MQAKEIHKVSTAQVLVLQCLLIITQRPLHSQHLLFQKMQQSFEYAVFILSAPVLTIGFHMPGLSISFPAGRALAW